MRFYSIQCHLLKSEVSSILTECKQTPSARRVRVSSSRITSSSRRLNTESNRSANYRHGGHDSDTVCNFDPTFTDKAGPDQTACLILFNESNVHRHILKYFLENTSNTCDVKWSEQTEDGAEKVMLVYFANGAQG